MLQENFAEVRVATDRESAVAEMMAWGTDLSALIIGVKERIDERVLDSLPALRVIGSVGTGTDHLDLAVLGQRGVRVVTTPGVNAVSVAEHAMMMILALAKCALSGHAAVLAGTDRAGLLDVPIELRGRRAGILGAGATARALLPLLTAFGVEPTFWTREPVRHQDLPQASLEQVFRQSQVLSIHLPLTGDTRSLIGPELLRLLPKGALVVNTARKEILDLARLPELLEERPDLRLAVDDFGLAADGTAALLAPTGLLSPHTAGVTAESLQAMQERAVRETVALARAAAG
ncbi:NAD(P)-dependent oxidoreductase [Streptomyces sp. NBC_00102]|uniref:NAD(P)-dependent oxidoreductase n=1 Tax=Streptomyces sp. NBC_00102 TaxID=2975652 RepID=UPI00225ACF6A|nr:NAD(P)-dependent oxidoreductase [Streptomyces sp. NBC_00102]MCX5397260.1 hypothetical protein [Streptomyces sp. NBC_00102]